MVYISAQAAVQRKLRPASWLPGVRNFHSEVQEWTFEVDADTAMDQVWAATATLKSQGMAQTSIDKVNRKMVIEIMTKAKWLDQLVFKFTELTPSSSKCQVENCSTGFLPLIIPAAPLINSVLCFFPFGDNGKCSHTMGLVRKEVEKSSGKKVIQKTLRYSITNHGRKKQADFEAKQFASVKSG